MSGIGRLWAGRLYGTNTGNLFIELAGDNQNLTGTLRFADDRFGPTVYSIQGSFNETTLSIRGDPKGNCVERGRQPLARRHLRTLPP
jgi:hypothetical protein